MWPSASEEGRHAAGREPGWEEAWDFDFVCADLSLGGAVRLGLRAGEAWYWAHLVGPRRDLVAVRDHDLDAPRGRALEVRGSGIWAEVTCETPLEHWSAGLEATGVAFDRPAEAYGLERGQPVAVGLDLEWEAAGAARATAGAGPGAGYQQPCEVHGDVLVGGERIEVDATGWRAHTWGVRDWWGAPWWRARGRLEDGTTLAAQGTSDGFGSGVVVQPGGPEPVLADARLEVRGPDALPGRAKLAMGEIDFNVTPLAHAPVLVPGPATAARLWRAVCRFSDAGGPDGVGWCERSSTGFFPAD